MTPDWEKGWRGRLYVLGRRSIPLSWRRAIRRRIPTERLLGIRKPKIEIPEFEFDTTQSPPGRPDILFLPVIAWAYRRQRPQQLAEALARRGRRVFYAALEGPGEPTKPTTAAPGVTLLPLAGIQREDPADRRLHGKALRLALETLDDARRQYDLDECAVVVETPFWAPLARELREKFGWKIIYDCLDEHSGFSTNRPGLLPVEEERLVADADLVVATSPVLLERLSQGSPNARLLPNACDEELFRAAPDAAPEGRPLTVGYVGAVDEWFDADLVEELARLRPQWSFEIVGSIEASRSPMQAPPPNVRFFGEKPHRELPALRSRFDAEIIPFRLTPLTHAVDPIKLYEAAAAGRPVVATPMRSLLALQTQGVVTLAATAPEFAESIERVVDEGPEASERRRAFARANTWDRRAEELDSWIARLYPLVSIIIVTYNGLAYTKLCLASLDHCSEWPATEILVVDNGSTDGTPEFLSQEAARRGANFRVLAFGENRGFAPAVNAGAAASRGDYLCFLNNDTVLTRGWLSALVRHLEQDPSLGMVGPSTNEIANQAKIPVGYADLAGLDSWSRQWTQAHAGRSEPCEMLAMFCVLLPKSLYAAVGPVDERFAPGMFEDDDYSRRIRETGFRLAVARDSFVHHWGRATFRALPEEEYLRIYEKNRRIYERKWASVPALTIGREAPFEELRARAEKAQTLFVFPPTIGWNVTLVQRPHHLARAFSRQGFPVVFQLGEEAPPGPMLAEIEPNLFLHRARSGTLPPLPHRIVWAFTYNLPGEESLGDCRLVYDVIDHPDVFPHSKRAMRRSHERALARADVVFAVSRPLLSDARTVRSDAVYLPNGVDIALFDAPTDEASVPERLARCRAAGRPVAGYLGALARWVDVDVIRSLAAARPDWDIVLVGETLDDSIAPLWRDAPANLAFLGRCPYAAVPSVLASFDAGLIPFRLGSEGFHASPIKLYEYLAAGLPVISTAVPECAEIPEVMIAADGAAFAAALDEARRRKAHPDFRARARDRARENDWSARASVALNALSVVRVAS